MRPVGLMVALLGIVASAAAPPREKVVVLSLVAHDKNVASLATTLTEQVLSELSATGRLDVLGESDVQALLGLERQKALLGCTEASSTCMAEIGGALGAPWLVSGSVAEVGTKVRLDLKLLRTADSKVVARQGKVLESRDETFAAVTSLVGRLVAEIPRLTADGPAVTAKPIDAPVVRPQAARIGNLPSRIMVASGVVVVLGGIVLLASDWLRTSQLDRQAKEGTIFIGYALEEREKIRQARASGFTLIALGAIVTGAGALWYGLSRPSAPDVALFVDGHGGYVSLRGEW